MAHFKRTIHDIDNSHSESHHDDNVMPIDDSFDYKKHKKGDDRYDTYEILAEWLTPEHLLNMRKDKFKINDRILVNPANQEGMELYRVCKHKKKGKDVKKIRDYYYGEYPDEEDEYEEDNHDDVDKHKRKKKGGKKNKSNKQRKSKKGGKTRKNRK